MHRTQDELDDVMMSSMTSSAVVMRSTATGARLLRPRNQTPVGRSGSGTRHSTGMYFTEVDVTAKNAGDFNYNIRSQDDISSGYSSAEPVSGLSRTSSMTNASKARAKSKRNEDKSMSASCTTLPRSSSRKSERSQGGTATGQMKTRNKSEK
nr:receptor expression enhancing protein A, isoform L [Drosophila melanogaster]AAG22198.3 receptor expression enhancing protein A, isoform L [Drosophila melanogaster]|eukprot:NP_001097426.1 receptor expression enhancing protein 1, isoform L [Drosophila melanogaster]